MLSAGGHERGGERAWTEAADRQTDSRVGGGEGGSQCRGTERPHNTTTMTTREGHDTVHWTCNYYHTHYYSGMNKM